ncbi:SPFH domain, Band 7 family protein [Alkalispirochaeta americana]|uniref:SPFH domain, Band 7 family protein n=1 Tax=Alkalispirochaeta americana TaxID=159291 RepID=A0A1N6QA92_9SPIO|nr:SPFH domain-containing protein [Alkalispirochaeta americana]SIQ13489.1 SPFH domain, Band 7 family protein [Alkalispirochaeta americana]
MSIFAAYISSVLLLLLVFTIFFKLIRIVPEQQAWVVEQLGKFHTILGPGLHLVIPVVQRVSYKQIMKEEVIDVPPQLCITKDNVQVSVDGILYLQVVDPEKASYGIDDYRFATAQLAQTTMRSEIGKIELDRSFSERDQINDAIVRSVDLASDPWGIKVTRYEIRDITPSATVMEAMQQQVRAEREKRAEVLSSEGIREARINSSKGDRQQSINLSQGERQRRINEAEGRAQATEIISAATAEGISLVASAIDLPQGKSAVAGRVAQQFLARLGDILQTSNTAVLPADLAQLRAVLDSLRSNTTPGGVS